MNNELSQERKEKLKALSEQIFGFAEMLNKGEGDFFVDSPIIDNIIISCIKHKHLLGENPKEILEKIEKLT